VAGWYWNKRKINELADKDDVKAVTKAVNGGYNGLDDRMDYLGRAKAVLGIV
jgi:putative chitinase